MALSEKKPEKEVPSTNKIEGISGIEQSIEGKIGNLTEQAKKVVEVSKGTAEISEFKRSGVQEIPEVNKEELEGKLIEELEPILANKLAKTIVADIEKDRMINAVIDKIVGQLANAKYDQKEENIATEISNIAYRVSNGDVGTYAWLQEELEIRVHEAIKKRLIM